MKSQLPSNSVQCSHNLNLEQFAPPCAREERISLVNMLFATRQSLQSNSKDAPVVGTRARFGRRRQGFLSGFLRDSLEFRCAESLGLTFQTGRKFSIAEVTGAISGISPETCGMVNFLIVLLY
ncbi:hypothetical protein Mal48_38360 [Thalassoglobus polymorphus]|uniref:Uncharacterized protein n=1 Tax=Thalassoglobus polymorphus TaxID=2527994 RepID=A0A517QSH1_9PLAN|nr:hypothetical protein Mal48_38360 [Thalassoglobus polymorphus]